MLREKLDGIKFSNIWEMGISKYWSSQNVCLDFFFTRCNRKALMNFLANSRSVREENEAKK